jgi:hypothetical protein
MSSHGWNIIAGAIALAAGGLILWGSAAQAWGDIRKYQALVAYEVDKVDKLLARFIAGPRTRWSPLILWQVAALPLVALRPDPSLAGLDNSKPGAGSVKEGRSLRDEAKQQLNNAAAWGLILFGSLLAIIAGLVQLGLVVFS